MIGIEGDFDWTSLGADASFPNLFANGSPVGSGIVTFNRDLNWLASVRGRVGWIAAPNWLLYATGGVAFANVKYSGLNAYLGGCPNCGFASLSDTKTGFTVGGGVEYAWTANWILRAEYLYYQFDGDAFTAPFQSAPSVTAVQFNFGTLDVNTFRVGVSYKF